MKKCKFCKKEIYEASVGWVHQHNLKATCKHFATPEGEYVTKTGKVLTDTDIEQMSLEEEMADYSELVEKAVANITDEEIEQRIKQVVCKHTVVEGLGPDAKCMECGAPVEWG